MFPHKKKKKIPTGSNGMKLKDSGIVLLVLLFVGLAALAEFGPSQKRDKTKTADLELVGALEAEA